jgi:methylaspartate mutase epsilon subunit
MTANNFMHDYLQAHARAGQPVIVQPRMGFSAIPAMQSGLSAVKDLSVKRIGTITLDSMTRQRLWDEIERAVKAGTPLNGFPIVTYGGEVTRAMLKGLQCADFPVQVRHGSPLPQRVFQVAHEAGIDAIEGGPISYCMPYGRVPLAHCIAAWHEAITYWATAGREAGAIHHLESFGGCMMGQLNPPALLAAISILESRFAVERGMQSISLSHSQGTNMSQDVGAILALRRLAQQHIPETVNWHIVLYTWMGVFPESPEGARRIIQDSGILAAIAGAERVIVKTAVEAFQIPTIEDNTRALQWVADSAEQALRLKPNSNSLEHAEEIYADANHIVEAVLNLDASLDKAILRAFKKGILDVPFCFHPDNRNEARAALDSRTGIIRWERTGKIPINHSETTRATTTLTADSLLKNLTFNQRKYDEVYQ